MILKAMESRFQNPLRTPLGRLSLGIFDESVGMPLPNAVASVKDESGKVVEELYSDSSGQTAIIDLPCPDVEYSMIPGSEVRPFAEYNVEVTAPDHETVIINGIEIFDNTTAIQNVSLAPAEKAQSTIDIKEHTLWKTYPPKIPEDAVKPLGEESGFVVLDTPVIPEFIVVHNGLPTDTKAQNYYIPFTDYIKNVASCEIYSTWPTSTITANVLAIISFTMNRVFTEWYRNKGFNFTITNSTAYDQAFSYGRNIFKEISTVVDDIFTSYITKPGIRQPLFTQYCDGQKTVCPNWMSQWGSKSLGDQGLGYLDILKRYYGQEIYLLTANKVSGVPVSYPGSPLQVGSTGKDVRTIQEQLNAISNNYPAIKKVTVDGVFGEGTRQAVETFQSIFDMTANGIVGFSTWYKISEIYVAIKKLASGVPKV